MSMPDGERFTALLRFQRAMRSFAQLHQGSGGPLTPEQTIPLVQAATQRFAAPREIQSAAEQVEAFLRALIAGKSAPKQAPAKVSSQALAAFAAWLEERVGDPKM